MTQSVYHPGLSADNSPGFQLPQAFSRRLSPPPLARRDGHSPQQFRKPAAPLRNPRFHGIGGE